MKSLLTPREVDRLLRYPRGRSKRLAERGQLPHIKLPDGELRFDQQEIDRVLTAAAQGATAADVGGLVGGHQ